MLNLFYIFVVDFYSYIKTNVKKKKKEYPLYDPPFKWNLIRVNNLFLWIGFYVTVYCCNEYQKYYYYVINIISTLATKCLPSQVENSWG